MNAGSKILACKVSRKELKQIKSYVKDCKIASTRELRINHAWPTHS